MSEPVTNVEIEDVLSSIRRLVTEDNRSAPKPGAAPKQDPAKTRLVLTPALRVAERSNDDGQGGDDGPAANVNSAQSDAPFELGPEFSHQTTSSDDVTDVSAVGQDSDQNDAPDTDVVMASETAVQADAPWTNPDATLHDAAASASDLGQSDNDSHDASQDDSGHMVSEKTDDQTWAENSESLSEDLVAHETLVFRHTDRSEILRLSEPILNEPDTIENASDDSKTPEQEPYSDIDLPETDWGEQEPAETQETGQDAPPETDAEDTSETDMSETDLSEADLQDENVYSEQDGQDPADAGIDLPFVTRLDAAALKAAQDATLSAKIEALEAAIAHTPGQWEPDDTGAGDYAGTDVETIEWQDDDTVAIAEAPDIAAVPAETAETLSLDDATLDEDTLRELVADIVREELQGALGERITRNVRKLVRREIHRALSAQELD